MRWRKKTEVSMDHRCILCPNPADPPEGPFCAEHTWADYQRQKEQSEAESVRPEGRVPRV